MISVNLEGQYCFNFENDSSGAAGCGLFSDWIEVPAHRWCCDTIEPVEGSSSLHHCFDNPEEGCDYLIFQHDPLNPSDSFSLSFRIRHSFAPSSQNNWQVALAAELSGGEEPYILNGIVVGVNYDGSDDLVKIWGVEDGEIEELCSTSLNYQDQVGTELVPLFRLDGNGEGRMDLYWSPDPGETEPQLLGSCHMAAIPIGRQLILRYQYSSARDRGLWMDGVFFEGDFVKDTVAPFVTSVKFVDKRTLLVGFSERVEISPAGAFSLTPDELPGSVILDTIIADDQGITLRFTETIPNRTPYHLRVEGMVDQDGNQMQDTVITVMRNESQWGDLVFNEVMADPDPSVRYDQEYLELYNRSEYPVNPEGWQLKVNERSYTLTTSMFEFLAELNPDEFGVISGITLPNEGALLSLYNGEGVLMHAASYREPWHELDWKKEGGWSLESPDAEQLCRVSVNWEYSTDPGGGTPGRINSNCKVLEDLEQPVLLYAGVGNSGLGNSGELLLHYSEPVRLLRDGKGVFSLDPGGVEPDSVITLDPLSEILKLSFSEAFSSWSSYTFTLPELTDCMGNISDVQEFRGGAVSQPVYGSVLINEMMYDPEEGFPPYVELYLPGESFIDLQDLAIHLVEEGGSPDNPIALASHSRLFLPGQYLVLTSCVAQLRDAYQLDLTGRWVEVEALAGLKRSSGVIYLTDRSGQIVDMAIYNDQMHMELLNDPRGISLERISVDRSGIDPVNWHSAASIEGYATPGRANSQSMGTIGSERLLDVEPEVFSPDSDGYNDLLRVTITTGENDWVVGLWITDLQGNRIRELANNHLAGPSATYIWDGEGENGAMQSMGFYVVHARGYRPSTGEQWVRRRAVGVVYR